MFTKVGLDRILVSGAILLSLFPTWHHESLAFTVSDLVFCLSLLTILLTRGVPRAPLGPLTPYWLAGFALLAVCLTVSSLVNGRPTRAFVVCAQYLFSFILLPLAIMGRDQKAAINLIQVFVAGAFLTHLAGVILYYSGYTGDLRFVTGSGRFAAFAGNPNTNAHMVALVCPLVLYLWLSGRMAAYLVIPMFLVLIVALVLTSSNNGIALTILGVFAFFVVLRELRYLARAVTGLAVCLVLILVWGSYWLPQTFEDRVLGAVKSGDVEEAGTFEDRVLVMEESLELLDETMLIGLGADQYRVLSKYRIPVHNTYLLLWTEGGMLALVGWLMLLGVVLVGSLVVARGDRLVAATAFSVGTVFALMGLTGAHMYGRYGFVPMHLALALVFASAAEARARGALRSGGLAENARRPILPAPPGAMARPAPPGARS
jgi:O-antigen ligase